MQGGEVRRVYPLGDATANLVGGGREADERDYTVERLFAEELREPASLAEAGELHAAGTDLRLTLCAPATRPIAVFDPDLPPGRTVPCGCATACNPAPTNNC